MRNKAANIFMFIVGAAVGSAVTWKVVKNKYEQIAQEEINSVKEVLSEMYKNKKDDTSEEESSEDDSEEDISDEDKYVQEKTKWDEDRVNAHKEYVNIANKYTGSRRETLKEAVDSLRPYIIPPEDYNEIVGYETESLIFYKDEVLAKENGEVIMDMEGVIGAEALDRLIHDDEYAIYVRNDRLNTDYEITTYPDNYYPDDDDDEYEESVDDDEQGSF